MHERAQNSSPAGHAYDPRPSSRRLRSNGSTIVIRSGRRPIDRQGSAHHGPRGHGNGGDQHRHGNGQPRGAAQAAWSN